MRWLAWHVIAGYARQHRLRTLVQILAIAVGVALGYAVHLINASALNEFSSAVRSATGQADASITGSTAGFDDRVLRARDRRILRSSWQARDFSISAAVLDTGAGDGAAC